uniref:Uncharacterized protein n=1 Tax=Romanomermis culicivorax TaxID=13658 RepID=A0A915I1Y4_ROMCU
MINFSCILGGRRLVADPNVDMSNVEEPPLDKGNMDNDGAFEKDHNMEDDSGIDNNFNDDGGEGVCFQVSKRQARWTQTL